MSAWIKSVPYYGLIASPFVYEAYVKAKTIHKKYEPKRDPGQPLTGFVKYELRKIGVHKPIAVQMEGAGTEGSATTNGNTIYVGFSHDCSSRLEKILYEQHELEELLEKDPSNKALVEAINKTERDLDRYRFVIQHEGTHIKNHDQEKSIIANAAMPFILCGALYTLNSRLFSASHPTFKTQVGKLALGVTATVSGRMAVRQYDKYREYRADAGVCDDAHVLKAGIEILKQHEKDKAAELIEQVPGLSYETLQQPFYQGCYAIFNNTHPRPLIRVERLEKRLAQLTRARNTHEKIS